LLSIGSKNLRSNIDESFCALKISNSTSTNNSKDKALAMILKNYVSPKLSDDSELPTYNSKSPFSTHKEKMLNQSNLSLASSKENLDIPDISFRTNKIIKREMFYERIIRKFKEQQLIVTPTPATFKHKSPEDLFKEKLDAMKKELDKIQPSKKLDVFPGYCKEIVDNISLQMCGTLNEFIIKGKNLRRSDIKTVYSPTAWINDEVINHYFNMIVERDPKSLHIFDTFFYCKLS